jgi:hypothetical protein
MAVGMKTTIIIAVVFAAAMASVPARADDIVALISQYRREHGLPAVKTDARLSAVAEHQAKAMAASGIMDHAVAGSFVSRIAGANTNSAGENIAAGTKTWAETLRLWKGSPGHNENLLLADGDIIGVAVAHNDTTRFKTYWAMVIGHRREGGKTRTASGRLKLFPADNDAAPDTPRATRASNSASSNSAGSNSPGVLDSIGGAIKRVTSPIRNLWN